MRDPGWKKAIRRLLKAPFWAAEEAVARLVPAVRGKPAQPLTQLFILGLPRSGTTLVYQYIVHRFHVAYFTNGVGALPEAPCAATLWQKAWNSPYRSDFKSFYGKVSGAMGPREAGAFWGRFFDLNAYQRFEDIPAGQVRRLRRSIEAVQAVFQHAPFVNKNVKHLLRIDALAKIFPRSRFLAVDRDLADVGLSILRGRKELYGDENAWFSVRTVNFEALQERDAVDQVAEQVIELSLAMNEDLDRLEPARVRRLSYTEFCADPESVFSQAPEIFSGLKEKNGRAVGGFEKRRSEPKNEREARLVERLKELVSSHAG